MKAIKSLILFIFTISISGFFIDINIIATPATENNNIIAQKDRIKRIQFRPGSSSAIVEDAVIRGTRDIYLLRANPGQIMTVNLSSLENNAVFEVIAPEETKIVGASYSWKGILSGRSSGDYQIIVGGTRGNASYRLEVAIR